MIEANLNNRVLSVADLGRVKDSNILSNDAFTLQFLDPAKAGRRGQADLFRDIAIGQAPILLEGIQDSEIDRIEVHMGNFMPKKTGMTIVSIAVT